MPNSSSDGSKRKQTACHCSVDASHKRRHVESSTPLAQAPLMPDTYPMNPPAPSSQLRPRHEDASIPNCNRQPLLSHGLPYHTRQVAHAEPNMYPFATPEWYSASMSPLTTVTANTADTESSPFSNQPSSRGTSFSHSPRPFSMQMYAQRFDPSYMRGGSNLGEQANGHHGVSFRGSHVQVQRWLNGEPDSLEDLASFPTACNTPPTCEELYACTDPACDDGIPCFEQPVACNPENCDQDVCHDLSCIAKPHSDDYCFDEDCPQETRCGSPCYDQQCGVPPCDVAQDLEDVSRSLDEGRQYDATLQSPPMDCVNPRCVLHDHSFLGQDKLDGSAYYSVTQPTPRRHDMDMSSFFDPYRDLPSLPACKFANHVIQDPHMLALAMPKNPQNPYFEFKHQHGAESIIEEPDVFECRWWISSGPGDPNARLCLHHADNSELLQQHIDEAHIDGAAKIPGVGFACQWDGCSQHTGPLKIKGFQARPKLKRHVLTHTLWKPHVCDFPGCSAEMKTKDAMDKHKRTHSGHRPYDCHSCDKKFATSTELRTHLIVHSGTKPHKCPICDERFADSSNLSKHKKTHEIGKYVCPQCGTRMKRWDQMSRHMRTQNHDLGVLDSKQSIAEYKKRMSIEFDSLAPEQKRLDFKKPGARNY